MIKMLNKIKEFIHSQKLFLPNETIVCATSGGVDSVCLLYILHTLGYNVVLAHVNHHKRAESEMEQAAMQQLANTLQIPFELLDFYDTHEENFQDAAHRARYDFFKTTAQKYKTAIIATAHHLDDQAETILMRLITGSNLYGYAGISVNQTIENYRLVRPLLCVGKDELYQYARENKLTYFEDSSNQSDAYLRNRIRHQIIPILKAEKENALDKFQEFSLQTKEAFQFIRNQSIKYLEELNNSIGIDSFLKLDVALQKDIICLLLERYNIEKNNTILHNCFTLIQNQKNSRLALKGNSWFKVEYGKAFIESKVQKADFEERLDLNSQILIQEKYLFYFSKKIPQNNANYLKLCYNDLKLPFFIRNRRKGDFIRMSYGNKKVARIMIDAKVPPKMRDIIPLVFDNEGELFWVYSLAKSQDTVLQKSKGDIFLVCEEINNG